MGYSHYWKRGKVIEASKFASIVADFKRTRAELTKRGAILANDEGKLGSKPTITRELVSFNGAGDDDSHETMYFPRELQPETWEREDDAGKYFQFTKTARKPYDVAVQTFLIIAKHHLGEDIEVGSDGTIEEWQDARELTFTLLGYGWRDFKLARD